MVKIINGEIVEDHDPRARSLMQAQQHFMLMQQQQQQQQQQMQQQQPPPYYAYPPYGYYPQYAYHAHPAAQHYQPEYQQYYDQQHHSPFAGYAGEGEVQAEEPAVVAAPSQPPSSSHLAPPSPAPLAHHSPSLTHRRLSLSSNPAPAGVPSPSLSLRRLSFSSHPQPPNPLSTPPVSARRLSLSSSSPLPHSPQPAHLGAQHASPPHLNLPSPPASLYPRRHPSSYNLFGLPSITIAEISVRPHVYLLAALLLYFIGPPVLVPLLASFFFYRWHLAREEQQKEKERVELKFNAARFAKIRPRVADSAGPRIHSLRDIPQG